jgi:hypothetical protein
MERTTVCCVSRGKTRSLILRTSFAASWVKDALHKRGLSLLLSPSPNIVVIPIVLLCAHVSSTYGGCGGSFFFPVRVMFMCLFLFSKFFLSVFLLFLQCLLMVPLLLCKCFVMSLLLFLGFLRFVLRILVSSDPGSSNSAACNSYVTTKMAISRLIIRLSCLRLVSFGGGAIELRMLVGSGARGY